MRFGRVEKPMLGHTMVVSIQLEARSEFRHSFRQ
jgi:hypothetical protein